MRGRGGWGECEKAGGKREVAGGKLRRGRGNGRLRFVKGSIFPNTHTHTHTLLEVITTYM